jgi:hypothetical protein
VITGASASDRMRMGQFILTFGPARSGPTDASCELSDRRGGGDGSDGDGERD